MRETPIKINLRPLWATFSLVVSSMVAVAQQSETPPIVADVLEKPALAIKDIDRVMMIGASAYPGGVVAVGERGSIVLSADQGVNWAQATSVPVSVSLTDVTFSTPEDGWVTGHSGVLLRSRDGGDNWEMVFDGTDVAQIVFDKARERVADGESGAEAELRSAQFLIDEGPDKPLLKVAFISSTRGWVLGAYGVVLETRDGGETWASIGHRIPNTFGAHLYDIARVGDRLLIAGEQGAVFASEDNGETFFKVPSEYEGTFFGVEVETDNTAIFHGLRGNVWRLAFEPELEPSDVDALETQSFLNEEILTENTQPKLVWTKIDNGADVTVSAARTLGEGRVVLADQGGRLTVSHRQEKIAQSIQQNGGGAVNEIIVVDQNVVIVVGPRGPIRIALSGEK